jgi:PilZ domain
MSDPNQERRGGQRVSVRLPVSFRQKQDTKREKQATAEQTAFTRDLSNNGIFFYVDREISPGTDLEMVLILPSELTAGERRWVCCQASVVRVEQDSGKNFGIAAAINRMDILPEVPEN